MPKEYAVTLEGYFDREIAPGNTSVLEFKMRLYIENDDTPYAALVVAQEQLKLVFSDGIGNGSPVVEYFQVAEPK